jgi:chromosome segregation ATPase
MLIQVTTKHGKPFRRAGLTFGPRPTRLWVGKDKPPDRRIQVIGADALARLEQASGERGPLIIERDVPHLRSADAEAELAAAAAERDDLARRLAGLDAQLAEEQARADTLAADLDRAHGRIQELERANAAAMERVNTLELAAVEAEERAERAERADSKPSRKRN